MERLNRFHFHPLIWFPVSALESALFRATHF